MDVLLDLAPNPATTLSVEELRSAIHHGRVHALARASVDGGQSWDLAWRVAGLPAAASAPNDDGLRFLIPVGRSGWAIAAGYFAILTLVADLGWAPVACAAPLKLPEALVAAGVSTAAVCALPLVFALLGHRAIKRDPQKHGMGRVWFAYVTVGINLLASFIAIVRALVSS